jgi:hypothetical protein
MVDKLPPISLLLGLSQPCNERKLPVNLLKGGVFWQLLDQLQHHLFVAHVASLWRLTYRGKPTMLRRSAGITHEITDRRWTRALAANPASEESGASETSAWGGGSRGSPCSVLSPFGPPLPSPRMPTAVHDGDYGNELWSRAIDNEVGESSEQGHPRFAMHFWKDLGMTADERQAGVKAAQKISAEPGRLALVPVYCLPNVFPGGFSNDQGKAHGFRCIVLLT